MNKKRTTIYELAEFYGLEVRLLDLPPNVAGYLDPHDEYIAVNSSLPHCEQIFTIAHELCHYISDHKKPRRKYRNWLLNQKCKSHRARLSIRFLRSVVNKWLPIELEADMLAMAWMVQCGGPKLLVEFLERHPEKKWLCIFVTADAMMRLPFRLIKALSVKLLLPRAES
jgi:hypothetical protein